MSRPQILVCWCISNPIVTQSLCLVTGVPNVTTFKVVVGQRKHPLNFQVSYFWNGKNVDYIANTGIAEIRASIVEHERDQSLQTIARERMHPKLHRMDISFDVLFVLVSGVIDREDAFFRHMTKPKLTGFGEVYYEGKEYEVRLTDKKPGQLSPRLRVGF